MRSGSCGPSPASDRESMPKSPAISRNRSAASASSRDTTRKRPRPASLPRAPIACSGTSCVPSRPISRERSRINAEVTGHLTESLGGIRVVKGYHAEETEARVFAAGADRLLRNIMRSIAAQNLMSLCSTVALGAVGALVMYLGARQVLTHRLDVGTYVEFTMLLAFMVAPIALAISIAGQLGEALAGLDRTAEILKETEEDREPERTRSIQSIQGEIAFADVTFAYVPGTPVLHGISFQAWHGTVTALVGSSGSGKSTIISLLCGFHAPIGG